MRLNQTEIAEIVATATSRAELWTKIFQANGTETVAEVGVWKGDFAKEVLQACPSLNKYYMIDPWAHLPDWNKPFNIGQNEFDAIYAEAINKTSFAAAKLTILRGRTSEVIDHIPDESLDCAYIDGDHTLRGITIDLIKLLPKIKYGGIIGGDDFTTTPWQHDVRFEPTLVCPFAVYFAEAMSLPIIAMPHNQFLIRKDRKSVFSFFDITGRYSNLSLNKLPNGWRIDER